MQDTVAKIRTVAQLEVEAALAEAALPPLYQQIAEKAKHLRELKMSQRPIGRELGVHGKTVARGCALVVQPLALGRGRSR